MSFMAPETRAMQDDDTANPAMLWVLEGEELWNRKAGTAGKACADCHSERGPAWRASPRAILRSMRARPAGRSRTAHQSVPRAASAGTSPRLREPRTAGTDRLCGAAITGHADRRRQRSATCAVRRQGARAFRAPRGPAQSVLRQLPRRQLGQAPRRDRRSRKAIPRAIRSTGWNGNRWARCSAACAAASTASGRSLTNSARPNWSTSNFI